MSNAGVSSEELRVLAVEDEWIGAEIKRMVGQTITERTVLVEGETPRRISSDKANGEPLPSR